MIWKYLVVFLIGLIVGYFVKDNLSKPDVTNEINNKIKQKGKGNLLNFFQDIKQKKSDRKALKEKKRKSKKD